MVAALDAGAGCNGGAAFRIGGALSWAGPVLFRSGGGAFCATTFDSPGGGPTLAFNTTPTCETAPAFLGAGPSNPSEVTRPGGFIVKQVGGGFEFGSAFACGAACIFVGGSSSASGGACFG